MKTTRVGRFLAVTIVVGLLTASFAIAQKGDRAEVLMHAAHQTRLVKGAIQPYAKALLNAGQCNVEPEFTFYVSFGYGKASLDIGKCDEQLGNAEAREAYERLPRDYAHQSDQVAAARTRLAVPGQPAGRSSGSTMVVALNTLRSTEPQIVSGLTGLGVPSWLWCKLHPRWCNI